MLKLGLSSKTYWTGSQPVQQIEKNSKTLPANSSKNKESNTKTTLNSELEWGRTGRNNATCLFFTSTVETSKWVGHAGAHGKMVSWLTSVGLPSKKLPEPAPMYPDERREGLKGEALLMPWRQRKPSCSGINPLTQNLLELDRLISHIKAFVIL